MLFRTIIFLIIIISGCNGTKTVSAHLTFPELKIENERYDRLILDRKPEYGYSGKDGCVVMREISMNITELSNGKFIIGQVYDSENKTPLLNAGIIFSVNRNGIINTIETLSDKNGMFYTEFDGKLKNIIVARVAYRTLKIDFDKL
ncbi:hypothetical protein [Aequorivita echinoideorum]|nr:hypothetical protein [Aequorivita echinoideorum]